MVKFYDEITKIGKTEIRTKAMSKEHIKKYISDITYRGELTLEKNYRKIGNMLKEKDNFLFYAKNQRPVKELQINIEWKKSRTWGYNPFAEIKVWFVDGSFVRESGFTCSGCGYDKESTVIAEICNKYLLTRLYALQGCYGKLKNFPYGAYVDFKKNWVRYNGGVGTSCYYRLIEHIGGKFENVASGDSFDVYRITFKK
jgi:polyhydroxyalkanoate synthesis regulator phasin